MAFTNQYKMENGFYTEFITDKIDITNNIRRDNLWEEFKDWYKKIYDSKNVPNKMDFIKFMSKHFDEPMKGGIYTNISYILDDNIIKSNLLDV